MELVWSTHAPYDASLAQPVSARSVSQQDQQADTFPGEETTDTKDNRIVKMQEWFAASQMLHRQNLSA